MSLTDETRRESYENVDKETLCKHIVEVLRTGRVLSAREVAEELYRQKLIPYPVRQAVAPRLTELEDCDVVEVTGKIYDEYTKRNVATYRLVKL